ncbi:MAG: hypothetical protein POH28_15445 [Acidocella sp.]|nr:hypothetical protein [Acidocella sp.]
MTSTSSTALPKDQLARPSERVAARKALRAIREAESRADRDAAMLVALRLVERLRAA